MVLRKSATRQWRLEIRVFLLLDELPSLMEKAAGVNLEAKAGAGVPKAARVVLTTPATLLEPVVLALAFPLDHFSNVERGDLLLG